MRWTLLLQICVAIIHGRPAFAFTGEDALDAAAKEVLGAVHPISERYKGEIGGQLVANGDGYSYGMPAVGDNGSVAISGIGVSGGYSPRWLRV